MTGRLVRAALALGLAQLIGCAQGYDTNLDQDPPIAGGGLAGMTAGAGRGSTSQAGGRAAGTGSGAAGTMHTGEPCERGATKPCMCEGDQGMGIRTCRKDDLSPTMGTFSPCESCVPDEDEPAGAGPGGNGSSGSGSAGRGGTGGTAGRAGSSSGSAGSSSGSAGRNGSGSGDPGWCLFVPVPLPGVCD